MIEWRRDGRHGRGPSLRARSSSRPLSAGQHPSASPSADRSSAPRRSSPLARRTARRPDWRPFGHRLPIDCTNAAVGNCMWRGRSRRPGGALRFLAFCWASPKHKPRQLEEGRAGRRQTCGTSYEKRIGSNGWVVDRVTPGGVRPVRRVRARQGTLRLDPPRSPSTPGADVTLLSAITRSRR